MGFNTWEHNTKPDERSGAFLLKVPASRAGASGLGTSHDDRTRRPSFAWRWTRSRSILYGHRYACHPSPLADDKAASIIQVCVVESLVLENVYLDASGPRNVPRAVLVLMPGSTTTCTRPYPLHQYPESIRLQTGGKTTPAQVA